MTDEEYEKELADRYQFQPFYVKWSRWWRWMPYYYALGLKKYLHNITYEKENRYLTLSDMMSIYKGLAHCKMKFYYTMEEVQKEFQEKINKWSKNDED